MNRISKITEHRLFQSLVYIKGIFGILEAAAGIVLLLAGSRMMARFMHWIFGHELLEDPTDPIGNLFMNIAKNLSLRMHIFFGIYLIVHGLVNIAVVFALIHKKRWAFPVAGAILILFVIYQIYELVHTFSATIFALTILDLIILSLLKLEYDKLKKR